MPSALKKLVLSEGSVADPSAATATLEAALKDALSMQEAVTGLYRGAHYRLWTDMPDEQLAQNRKTLKALSEAVSKVSWDASNMLRSVEQSLADRAKAKQKSQGVSFNLDAGDLELYSGVPGLKQAAKALNAALETAAKEMLDGLKDIPEWEGPSDADTEKRIGRILGRVFEKHVRPVMGKYRDQGASDSEPRDHLTQALIDVIKNHYGLTRSTYTRLGDFV